MFYPQVIVSPIGREYQLYRCDYVGCGRTSAVPANSGIFPRQWEEKEGKHYCHMKSCIHKRRSFNGNTAHANLIAANEPFKQEETKSFAPVKVTDLLAGKVFKHTCFRCGAGSETGADWSYAGGKLTFCNKRSCRDYAANHQDFRMIHRTEVHAVQSNPFWAVFVLLFMVVGCAPMAGEPTQGTTPPPSSVTISVSPASATLSQCESYQFGTLYYGTTDTRTQWSVRESGGGTITASGYYTAPTAPGTYHIDAISIADPTKTSTATVVVEQVVTSLTWSVQEVGGGTITSVGLYTAPNVPGTYTVTATATPTSGKVLGVEVSPKTVTLQFGQTQSFSATIATHCSSLTVTAEISKALTGGYKIANNNLVLRQNVGK